MFTIVKREIIKNNHDFKPKIEKEISTKDKLLIYYIHIRSNIYHLKTVYNVSRTDKNNNKYDRSLI